MVRIKSLSIPDTNKVPANGGTIVIKGVDISSSLNNDYFQTGPSPSLWNVSNQNVLIQSEPFRFILQPQGLEARYFLESNYSIPLNSSFFFHFGFNFYRNSGQLLDDFMSKISISDGVNSIDVSLRVNDIESLSELIIGSNAGPEETFNLDSTEVEIYVVYTDSLARIIVNNLEPIEFSISFDNFQKLSLEYSSESTSDEIIVEPKFVKNYPLISGMPSLNSLGYPEIHSYKSGDIVANIYPGSPGLYNLTLSGSGDRLGESVELGELEVLKEKFGEDSLKFLLPQIESFYDDFNRLSACPATARAGIANSSRSTVVHNRCICDGSTSQEEITIGIRKAGNTAYSNRGPSAPTSFYIDENKRYGENFNFERVILPKVEHAQDFPINNLRMLKLSTGKILYYGVKSQPLVNNSRQIHIKLSLKQVGEIYEEQSDQYFPTYKRDYTLIDLQDNSIIQDVQGETTNSVINLNYNLPVGKYMIRVYDSDAEIRLDSITGPLIDIEEDIESRFEYNFQHLSSQWPEGGIPVGFEYLSENKYVEFVFDVKRYNGKFLGYLYDPCSGSLENLSSIYDDVNLSTDSYSVIESENGDLYFLYLPISGEEVYNSRTSSIRFREIDMNSFQLSEEYLSVGLNRDSERIISGRPRLSIFTGNLGVPSYITPTVLNLSLPRDFIHSFDAVKTADMVKCFVTWGNIKSFEVRESHRLYKISNRRLKVDFEIDGGVGQGFYQPEIDNSGSAKCYYVQSPSVSSQLEVYTLNPLLSRNFEELQDLWRRGFLSSNILKIYDLVSYENVYNYTRNFISNTQENLPANTVIDVTVDPQIKYRIIDNSFRYMIKSVGPSYIRGHYDSENDSVILSLLDFLKKMPLVISDSGIMGDICAPLHFSCIDFINSHKGEVFQSFSSCIGPDGFVYSVASTNSVRNSMEIGVTDPSIMLDPSNTYVFENISKVRDNNKYVKQRNAAFYKNDYIDYIIPCMNSYRKNEGLVGIDIQRIYGYLMMSSGSSGANPCVFVANNQDVYPFSIQNRQMFLPDVKPSAGGSLIFSSVQSDGITYTVNNSGVYTPRISINLANDPLIRDKLSDGYRFRFRLESVNGEMTDPYFFDFMLRRRLGAGSFDGVNFKVKYYGSSVGIYRAGTSGDILLGSIDNLPEGIIDLYVMAKPNGPDSKVCRLSIVIKQPDHLKLFKDEEVYAFNFKNSYYKEIMAECPITFGAGQLMLSGYQDNSSQTLSESVKFHQIDWGIMNHAAGSYTYSGTNSDLRESFFINSTRLSRVFTDDQVFIEGTLPDHYLRLTQRYDNSGRTYERHWPYGFVTNVLGSDVKASDRWFLSRDFMSANSLNPFNVHTVWTSNEDGTVGKIWANANDSNLDKFNLDTLVIDGINFPEFYIVGKNLIGDSWLRISKVNSKKYELKISSVIDSGSSVALKLEGSEPVQDLGETLYLYQENFRAFKVIEIIGSTIYIEPNGQELPFVGMAKVFSSKCSKILDQVKNYRFVGIEIEPFNTHEGYYRVGSLGFGKYSEIPIENNHTLGTGISYSLDTQVEYAYSNQPYFVFDTVIKKDYSLSYSIFDSMSYMKFRNVLSETSVSRSPVWIIDRYKVDNKEFNLCLIDGDMSSGLLRDDPENIVYTVNMKFRSIS